MAAELLYDERTQRKIDKYIRRMDYVIRCLEEKDSQIADLKEQIAGIRVPDLSELNNKIIEQESKIRLLILEMEEKEKMIAELKGKIPDNSYIISKLEKQDRVFLSIEQKLHERNDQIESRVSEIKVPDITDITKRIGEQEKIIDYISMKFERKNTENIRLINSLKKEITLQIEENKELDMLAKDEIISLINSKEYNPNVTIQSDNSDILKALTDIKKSIDGKGNTDVIEKLSSVQEEMEKSFDIVIEKVDKKRKWKFVPEKNSEGEVTGATAQQI